MLNQDELQAHFRNLSNDELIRQCLPGRLTEIAQSIAEAELVSRGLPRPEIAESVAEGELYAEYHGDLTNVARFLEPTEAHLLKSYLESCSIPAFVADANLVQVNPFFGGAIGGTSLRVPAEFVPEALDLLAKFHKGEVRAANEQSGEIGTTESVTKDFRLKTYRVYACPGRTVPIVVKVGFSWAAFIFGPLWFLVNYMWLNFMIVAGLFIGGNLYFRHHRPETEMESLLFLGMYLFYLVIWILIGKFANTLLAGELEDRGYRLLATVRARNSTYARDEAAKSSANEPGRA
ncbi:MAG: DUF2628 domain-containing protein [Gammaproteobacteria bacterium]|nr:DUF2628 domain-containing protein [Gammaproteobacteria bacterium]MBU1601374.1 DUF2628 domain-containing protein [Gammaproteobacteria bacterium]MBU2433569.1 DUF2628 domain-containing protein [Gammaproteobacteria bacterium]MBU2449894.1 DUF2628 domain-containing protein [Gammaproteobacteria bacterium]